MFNSFTGMSFFVLQCLVSTIRPWKLLLLVLLKCYWSNRTQFCQRLATAATFLRMKLFCPGAMTRTRLGIIQSTTVVIRLGVIQQV